MPVDVFFYTGVVTPNQQGFITAISAWQVKHQALGQLVTKHSFSLLQYFEGVFMQCQPERLASLFLDHLRSQRLFMNVLPRQLFNVTKTKAGVTAENKCFGDVLVEMRCLHQGDVFLRLKVLFSPLVFVLFGFYIICRAQAIVAILHCSF